MSHDMRDEMEKAPVEAEPAGPAPRAAEQDANPAPAERMSGAQFKVFREAAEDEEEEETEEIAQEAGMAVELAEGENNGQPLPRDVRQQLEASLGKDLSAARVHDGTKSNEAAEALGANAFTVGQNIHMGPGAPKADTPAGQKLLAHEATHTIQQGAGGGGAGHGGAGGLDIAKADSTAELEAESASDAAAAGRAAAVTPAGGKQIALDRKKKKEELPDWEPGDPTKNKKKPTPDTFEPIVVASPDEEEATVLLGGTYKTKYSLGNYNKAPKGTSFEWEQSIAGRKTSTPEFDSVDKKKGTSVTSTFHARAIGERNITTRLWKTGTMGLTSKADAPNLKLNIPHPKVESVELNSYSKDWGKRPVLDKMLAGEDLLVAVKYADIDPKLDQVAFVAEGPFTVKKPAKRIGNGVFETVLTPSGPGKKSGHLMLEALEHYSPLKARFEVDVTEKLDQGEKIDPGFQPENVGDAVDQVKDAMFRAYESRQRAVSAVKGAAEVTDPPPKPAWWKTLVKAAAEAALGAFAGKIGSLVGEFIGKALINKVVGNPEIQKAATDFVTDHAKDGAKMLVEPVTGKLGLGDKDKDKEKDAKDKAPDTAKGGGGHMVKGIGEAFEESELKALSLAEGQHSKRMHNIVKNRAQALEQKEPGSGFRYAMVAKQGIMDAVAADTYYSEQYSATFNAYCNLLAQNGGGSKDPGDRRDASSKVETDLSKIVSTGAENLEHYSEITGYKRHKEGDGGYTQEPIIKSWGGGGVQELDGALRLDLKRVGGSIQVKKAKLTGIKSKEFAQEVKKQPFSNLNINIIGQFDEGETGAVIGRNEKQHYYASSHKSKVLEDFYSSYMRNGQATASPEEIAKIILEKEVANAQFEVQIG